MYRLQTVKDELLYFFSTAEFVYFHEDDVKRDDLLCAKSIGVLPLKIILDCTVSRTGGRGIMIRKME